MGRIRFWAIAIISFFSIAAGTIWHRFLVVSLCTVLGFHSTACFVGDSGRVNAAVPPVVWDGSSIIAQNVDIFRNDGGNSPPPQTDIFNNPNPQGLPQPGIDIFNNPNTNSATPNNLSSPSRLNIMDGMQGSNQDLCSSTANASKTYYTNSSNTKKRFEAQSNFNEKLLLEVLDNATMVMYYKDCKSVEFLLRFKKDINSSKAINLLVTRKSIQKVQPVKIAGAIDPNLEFRCSSCEWITEILQKFDNAKDFDDLLNERIPVTYKITQSLVRQDFSNAIWESYEQAKSRLKDELEDPLKPLKNILKALYDKAMGCNTSFASECAAGNAANEIEQGTNQRANPSVTPTSPNRQNACSEQITEEEKIKKYCTPDGRGRIYFICLYGREQIQYCPGFYGNSQ